MRAGAFNAVLMQHALMEMGNDERAALWAQVLPSALSGARGATEEFMAKQLRNTNRIVQLNICAIAMADLQAVPRLPGELWMGIANPWLALPDTPKLWQHVRTQEEYVLRKHGAAVTVPKESLFQK